MIEFNKVRVLVTDGGGRQTLTIIHSLRELGCRVSVICHSKRDVCFVSRIPDKKILFVGNNLAYDESYAAFVMDLVMTGDYDVLLPVAEKTTDIISNNELKIGQYVRIACAPREAYIKAFNKQCTFDVAINNGVPCPYTRKSDQSVENYLDRAVFPIIIKPRQGMGSMGFHKFETIEEFRDSLSYKRFNPDDYVIQEFVHFDKRIDAFLFIDQNGEVKTSMAVEVLRWYPLDAGTSTFTRTVRSPDVIKHGIEILQSLHWKGFADVSFMIDKKDNKPKLMEINGRIPAGIKLSWYCGFNVARQLVEMAYDEPVITYSDNEKFNLMARHSQADLMWFLKSKDRFKAKPSWFSWKNTTDLVYWKDDPKPFFVYTFSALLDYRKFMKKRQH